MATQEKLLKSLETLRQLVNSNQTLDPMRKKEKIQHCNIIVEAMLNPTIKIAKNFHTFLSFAMDVLLQLCDDQEADVRMTADECLNKIIRAMGNNSVTKVQIELHKEIKANGSARSLRAALWRFALLAHHIRPHKGKPYVINLVPCIVKILERSEDLVHETLANSMGKIMETLGCFTMDKDIKCLLDACLRNVKTSQSTVIRRTSCSCILSVCLNCRKPYIYLSYILNHLVEYLIPVQDNNGASLILGVLGCLKSILPKLKHFEKEAKTNSYNFTSRKDAIDKSVQVDRYLQVYELCLHYSTHSDHNIVNASLETLNTLFQNCSKQFEVALLNSDGIKRSQIFGETVIKAKTRSPSQLSIATTLVSEDNLPLDVDLFDNIKSEDIEKWIDESKLSVINVNYVKDDKAQVVCDSVDASVNNSNSKAKCFDYSNISIGTVNDQYADSLKSESVAELMDRIVLSEDSSEKSASLKLEEKSQEDIFVDVDVGDYLDKSVPLIYCGRLIAKQFLLGGIPGKLVHDKKVRVSTKNLALTCLSSIVQIYPKILVMQMDRNPEPSTQRISDILLFAQHGDPQLRGIIRILISNFVKAVFVSSQGNYALWNSENGNLDCYRITNLMDIILKGLKDESSTCSRQSLVCLNNFLRLLLNSALSIEAWAVLNYLPILAQDPYWLVKVKLLEVVSDLEYVSIEHAFPASQFQNKVIFNILFELIKDEDQRVRMAASTAIVTIISKLYFKQYDPNDTAVTFKAVAYRNLYIPRLFKGKIDGNISKKHIVESMPFPFNSTLYKLNEMVELSLGKIITKLFQYLLTTTSKYYIYGCIETLNALSAEFPTSVYKKAWSCFKTVSVVKRRQIFQRSNSIGGIASPIEESFISSSADLLNVTVHLLTNGIVCYDLNCHLNLITLTGNLFAGKWLENMKSPAELISESARESWDLLSDKALSQMSEVFLIHVVKMLNIFSHIIDEAVPNLPQSKLPNLPSTSSLSPIKRKKSDLGEKKILSPSRTPDKEEKKVDSKVNAMGYFANSPHYMKFYEILKVAYNNYKITLESGASENFLNLLKSTLNTFSQILEVATLTEIGRISEEILSYLKSIFHLESAATVLCVQQLLKSLFGTNLSSDSEEILLYLQKSLDEASETESGFYGKTTEAPIVSLENCITALNGVGKVECDGDSTVMGYLHRKENKIGTNKGSDKILANYIRIFEPMVIESLKHYTITSNVHLQCQVLQLLGQLVQLRVNYCLLDSEQIFIGFVLKQFEFIEEGQISLSDELIPKIFQFLVHLSYGKQHSKSIIDIPKIIQLCDGLMASGQSPLTHCIPALKPIVEDVFLLRNKSNTPNFKDLETAREFLVSMLLRLLEYGEIIDLFVLVLNESKYCDNSERWIRLSRQVFDVFLALLQQNKVKLDEGNCFDKVVKLIFALHPSAYKEVDKILINLFGEPPAKEDRHFDRYLGKVSILMLILLQMKEDKLLTKIAENQKEFALESVCEHVVDPDPLNVTKICDVLCNVQPEIVLIRFLFRVVSISLEKCVDVALSQENDYIVKQLSFFLLTCVHIFQSVSHSRVRQVSINVFCDLGDSKKISLGEVNKGFLRLRFFYPLLTYQWCQILSLVNYNDTNFWSSAMKLNGQKDVKLLSINEDIVRIGASIVYSDFLRENRLVGNEGLCWFVNSNIQLLVELSAEAPVAELFSWMHGLPNLSEALIQAISSKCLEIKEPEFEMKILVCVQGAHNRQTGKLLTMLIPKLLEHKQVAVSRNAVNLASRRVELLLTLPKEEAVAQLTKEDLTRLMQSLVSRKLAKKHEMLVGLLNKLATQFYDLKPVNLHQRQPIDPECIRNLNIDKDWYVSIIKSQCESGYKAELLSKLDYDEVMDVLRNEDFPKSVLRDCLNFGSEKLLKVCSVYLFEELKRIRDVMPSPHHVFLADKGDADETKYKSNMCGLFSDESFLYSLKDTVLAVDVFVRRKDSVIPEASHEDFVLFSVACLELVAFLCEDRCRMDVGFVSVCVSCCDSILKKNPLCTILGLDAHVLKLCSAVNCLHKLIGDLLVNSEPLPSVSCESLDETLGNPETRKAGNCVHQLSVLVCWLQKLRSLEVAVPKCLFLSLRSIVISLGRLPLVNSYVLTPPTAWRCGLSAKMTGLYRTQVPPLPIDYLQEIEILEEFIFRITLLGWSSRQQFEETWMCLLSVLSANPSEESSLEEINAITHSTSLVVQAITSLLLQTLYYPRPGNSNVSTLIHVSRDPVLKHQTTSLSKLKALQTKFHAKMLEQMNGDISIPCVFNKPNLEKQGLNYSYGQVSVEYLQVATKVLEIKDEENEAANVYLQREKVLSDIGLDLNSCLQFLLDLYTQWIKSEDVLPLRLLQEVVKSILSISDLFSEKSEFVWMLDIFSELAKSHAIEDEIIHQYLVVGICKAMSVLTPDAEAFELAKKIITQCLKSAFISARISSIHGLLYILQMGVLGNTVIGGVSEDLQIFLPIAIEYIQCHINSNNNILNLSQDHTLLVWSLAFYLIENIDFPHLDTDFVNSVFSNVLTLLYDARTVKNIYIPLMKGLERLVIKQKLPKKSTAIIMQLALDKLKNANPVIALPAAQLLFTCMYIEYSDHLEIVGVSNGVVQSNPDHLVQTIEKISVIFDRIKKGFPFEVEILSEPLSILLNDFFSPEEILTKVISEFLSPQQRHPMQLSKVVFKIFEYAIQQSQLSLLQDWVVFSLTNFTQSFSIGMATWCLTCFFISASTNVWLRNVFPYVQKRIGRYEYEDRRILCIAGSDFYNNLSSDAQRKMFVDSLLKVKDQVDMPFNELLGCL